MKKEYIFVGIILVVLAINLLSSIPLLYNILPVSSSIKIALLLVTTTAFVNTGNNIKKSITNIFFIKPPTYLYEKKNYFSPLSFI